MRVSVDIEDDVLDNLVVDVLKDALDSVALMEQKFFDEKDVEYNRKLRKALKRVIEYYTE